MQKENQIESSFPKKLAFAAISTAIIFAWLGYSPATSAEKTADGGPAPEAVRFSENFDGVAAPALPSGWAASSTGATGFVTSTDGPDGGINAVLAPIPPTTSTASLVSPVIYVSGINSRLNFRQNFAFENTWDGGILEISINGNPFQDITTSGAAFISGGYNSFLNPSTNPLGSRNAWSGGTAGFITTSIQLPASTFRQQVQFRWRCGSNDSFSFSPWRIDTVSLETIPTAANSNAVSIPSSGTASPYSSDITISGQSGLITGLILDLENFSHSSPDDVDILLVAPNGRKVVLMSDAGGTNATNSVSLTFDDQAGPLPDSAQITAGSYRPSDFEPGDLFPLPAPSGPLTGNSLSAFVGGIPNGTWKLFVVDDTTGNAGAFSGGWNITIQSSLTACPMTFSSSGAAIPVGGGSGNFQVNIAPGCDWTASSSASFLTISSGASGNGSGTVQFSAGQNLGGGRTANIIVSNNLTTRSFLIQQGSGCPLSLDQSALNFPASGGTGSVGVTAGGVCNWQAASPVNWIIVTTPAQNGNGTFSFNVLPNQATTGRTATLTVGAQSLTVNQPAQTAKKFDFDGDGKADISVFRPADSTWYLLRSLQGFTGIQFGIASDKLVPADYDGDGKTDIGVFRNGTWFLLRSAEGFFQAQFGLAGDIPAPADYNGDGKAEIATFRNGAWNILDITSNQASSLTFGVAGDKAVPGDYDGDGKADQAIYRNGEWHLNRSSQGYAVVQFGIASDTPVAADYDGDGKEDQAVYRGGTWFLLRSSLGFAVQQFGLASDKPAPADYDGDGKADLGVFRNGEWYLLQSNAGFSGVVFGLSGDSPLAGAYLP